MYIVTRHYIHEAFVQKTLEGILAEGAKALSVTLSGGVLFAS